MKLSIIVIGKNESRHIGKCLSAALTAAKKCGDYEIIYADSASTDDTVEKASRFPVTIVKLKPEWQITSSAGRYIGYMQTRGDYLLFIDGDTLIYKQWPETAIRFLEAHPDAGGVAGILHEIFLDKNGFFVSLNKNRYHQRPKTEIVPTFGGTAMYRREAMETAGSFNPWVLATPELETALRIRKQGYLLYRIYEPMAITYAPERESLKEVLRRANTNLYAMGNTFRYCLKAGTGLRYLKERMMFIIRFAAALLVLAAAVMFCLLSGRHELLIIPAGAVLVTLILYTVRRGSLRRVLLSFVKRSVILYRTITSFIWLRVRINEAYPLNVTVIREHKGSG